MKLSEQKGAAAAAATGRRTQAERRAATRAKVMRAAARVFAARGFQAATLDEVAEKAGLSKGAVYYNFDSKDELFLSLLEELLQARLDDAERTLERDAQKVAAGDFLTRLQRDPRWPPLFFEFVAYAARTPAVRRRFRDWVTGTRAGVTRLLEGRLAALGVEPMLPPERLAVAVSALANGMLIESLFDPKGAPPEALDEFVTLLVTGSVR